MNLQQKRIALMCAQIGLARMGVDWPGIAQDAARGEDSHGNFLEKLLAVKNDARLQRQRDALMKIATLPGVKTIEEYNFGFASGAPRGSEFNRR